jgi:hypothetical protein
MNYRFILRRSRGAFVHGIIILSTAPMSFCFVAAAQMTFFTANLGLLSM